MVRAVAEEGVVARVAGAGAQTVGAEATRTDRYLRQPQRERYFGPERFKGRSWMRTPSFVRRRRRLSEVRLKTPVDASTSEKMEDGTCRACTGTRGVAVASLTR